MKQKTETILVTGGAGFIGSHVCEGLIKRGDSVLCVDNFNDYYDPKIKEENIKSVSEHENFELHKVDICDKESLNKVFEKYNITKIIHLAARAGVRPSIKDPFLYEKVNIKGTLNLLELSREYNVKNFIFGSSSSVYGINKKVPFSEEDSVDNPISPYAATKRSGELICYVYHSLYDMNITCLRFFTVYGPRGRPDMAVRKFTEHIYNEKEIEMYGDGESQRDYTFVGDIVDGVIAAVENELKFEIINLGNNNTVSLKYLIATIETNLEKKANIIRKDMQPGDVPITYADISKGEKLLGYKPKVKIEEGIRLFVEWFMENK